MNMFMFRFMCWIRVWQLWHSPLCLQWLHSILFTIKRSGQIQIIYQLTTKDSVCITILLFIILMGEEYGWICRAVSGKEFILPFLVKIQGVHGWIAPPIVLPFKMPLVFLRLFEIFIVIITGW